jgi:hypothetical protein
MKIDVYCDETLPDLFTSQKPQNKLMLLGSLWIENELREQIKTQIKDLRKKHNCWGEIKWTKVSPSKENFYLELVDIFFAYGMEMRFRCIAIDPKQVTWSYHGDDKELGFYKFYYQLIHKWIKDFNTYNIFLDAKKNRDLTRLSVLKDILNNQFNSSFIEQVQALPSKEVALIQLSDFLLGATSAKLNQKELTNTAKIKVIEHIEKRRDKEIAPTWSTEKKFNIFKINLQGGL